MRNIKDLYIDFFISKDHKQIPSAPIVTENDPSSRLVGSPLFSMLATTHGWLCWGR